MGEPDKVYLEDAEKLLTVRDVAERFSVTTVTVYNMVKTGKLPHVRLSPKLLRFRENDITHIMTKHYITLGETHGQ